MLDRLLLFTFFVLPWIIFCSLVARFAESRGRNIVLAFLSSVVFTPVMMFIIYLIIGKKVKTV